MNVQQIYGFHNAKFKCQRQPNSSDYNSGAFFFFFKTLHIVLAPLPSTLNIWWMNEQMNKLMNIPVCFFEYAMVQTEEQEDKKGKRRKPPLSFLFLCLHPLQHPHIVQVQSKNISKSEHAVQEEEWDIWPWYFYFNMFTFKGQKKGQKTNNT